ncbi:MAG: NADH-quinone oxidoreductase subunit H [Bacteroidetes bacterium]|nr:NADH-quinone oxidoreductase subunit H [Bacteroidota bacterium]
MSSVWFILPFLLFYTVFAVYAERKLSAFIQNRLGPMEAGPWGLFQSVADLLKLLHKEHIAPASAHPILFRLAPVILFASVFAGMSVLPVGPGWGGAGISSPLFFMIAVLSVEIIGVLAAGYASGNKYSTLGAVRSVAQIISYEIPLGLCVLCVVLFTGSMDLNEISLMQGPQEQGYFLGIPALMVDGGAGFAVWNIFKMPVLIPVWIIFFICSLAESNRAPFDLPEAESELVAGFHTEYSGFPWAVIMLAEYGMMLLTSLLSVILFFGSWNSPLPDLGSIALNRWTTGPVWGVFWLYGKGLFLVMLQIWVRWTFPRVRINQMISLSWKYLTPAAMVALVLTGLWRLILI